MTEPLAPIALVDIAFRGGTVAILLLLTAHLAMRLKNGPVIVAGVVFCVTGVIEAVINTPVWIIDPGLPEAAMISLQQLHFIAMWWFIMALFDDTFEWRPRCFLPVLIVVPLIAGSVLTEAGTAQIFRALLAAFDVTLLATMLKRALTDPASDLVSDRRAFRRVLAFSVPPFTLCVMIINLVAGTGPADRMMCTVYAAVYCLMAIGFSFWLTRIKETMVFRPEPGTPRPVAEPALTAADRLELERVQKVVAGGLYLEAGLTIGGLGDILDIPEHRLRRLINRGLGYRNFAAFVNDYRIEEAKRRLSDPALAREQIVQHAFSLGYASLAPFNRAFRERVGISPTEFREMALAEAAE